MWRADNSTIVNKVYKEIHAIDQNNFTFSTTEQSHILDVCQSIETAIDEAESESDFRKNISDAQIMDSRITNILLEYVAGMEKTTNDEELGEYLNDMLNELQTSNLSKSTANALGYAFKIGAASALQWDSAFSE